MIRGTFIERDAAPLHASIKRAMEQQYETFGKLHDLSREIRNKPKLAAAALPHIERTAATLGSTIEQTRARRAAVDKELTQKIESGAGPAAAEMRAFLQRLPKGEAMVRVMEAARRGDRKTVAAALSEPPYLSGLDDKQRESLFGVVRETLEPTMAGLLADIDANLARLEAANTVFLERSAALVRDWRDCDDAIISEKLGAVS